MQISSNFSLRNRPVEWWLWGGPLLFTIFVAAYFVLRYQGNWAETDSSNFAQYTAAIMQQGRLIPENSDIYPNGFAFQSISAYIVAITGLDIPTLQQIIYPMLAPLTVLPAWLVYRELTGSARGATIASFLLFTQPEFLFVVLRSSHEKFTRALLLLALYWLVRSFKYRQRPWQLATYVVLFYLTTFAMIASNNLISNSFIFAVAIALILGLVLSRFKPSLRLREAQTYQRLTYVTIISLGLVFVFTFYSYTPARNEFVILKTIWERVAALFLDVQQPSATSYNQLLSGWISLPVYFALSIANWIILGASFLIWAGRGWNWFFRKQNPPTISAWLLWLLYTAFAMQGAASVVSDASGYIGNLQVRIFPSISIMGVALVASAVANWKPRPHWYVRPLQLGLTAVVFCFAILSVLKATNEPALSNKWTFYQPQEVSALIWSDNHLKNSEIWTDFDERLRAAFVTVKQYSTGNNRIAAFEFRPGTRTLLITDITRMRVPRLQQALPLPPDALQVYDTGSAQLYRLRPQTPYQQ